MDALHLKMHVEFGLAKLYYRDRLDANQRVASRYGRFVAGQERGTALPSSPPGDGLTHVNAHYETASLRVFDF